MTRFTVITPTIVRPSLVKLCESLNTQVEQDWEHIVALDVHPSEEQLAILEAIKHPQRLIVPCIKPQGRWGYPLRYQMWEMARGDYLVYTDDDCYYVDDYVTMTLRYTDKPWAIWPLIYHGVVQPWGPIRVGASDNNQFMVKRSVSRFPAYEVHEGDGLYLEQLAQEFPDFEVIERPLVVYP